MNKPTDEEIEALAYKIYDGYTGIGGVVGAEFIYSMVQEVIERTLELPYIKELERINREHRSLKAGLATLRLVTEP